MALRRCLTCGRLTPHGSYCLRCFPRPKDSPSSNLTSVAGYKAGRRVAELRAAGRCEICDGAGPLECHHRQTAANGGANSPDNLIMVCHDCHRARH